MRGLSLLFTLGIVVCLGTLSTAHAQEHFRMIDPPYFMESSPSRARIAWSPEAIAVMQGAKGFRVSYDDGQTWSKWHFFGKYVEDVYFLSRMEMLALYLDFAYNDAWDILALTTDGGNTWLPIDTLRVNNGAIFESHGKLYLHAGTQDYTYNDFTRSLDSVPAPTPSFSNMVRDMNGSLYTADFGLHKSTDAGLSWKELWRPMIAANVYQIALYSNGVFFELADYDGMKVIRYDFNTKQSDTVLFTPGRRSSFGTLVNNPYSETSYLISDRLLEYDSSSKSYKESSVAFPVPYTVPTAMNIDSTLTWHIITNDGRYYTLPDGGTQPILHSGRFRGYYTNASESRPLFLHSPGDSLFLFYNSGMYRTTDDGDFWNRITATSDAITSAAITDAGFVAFVSGKYLHIYDPRTGNIVRTSYVAFDYIHYNKAANSLVTWREAPLDGWIREMNLAGAELSMNIAPRLHITHGEILPDGKYLVLCDSGTIKNDDTHLYIGKLGLGWNDISPAANERFMNVVTDDAGDIFAAYRVRIESTTDEGQTWQILYTSPSSSLNWELFSADSQGNLVILDQPYRNQYAPIHPGLRVYNKSKDTWSLIELNLEFIQPVSITLTGDGFIYLLTNEGLLKSDKSVVTSVLSSETITFSFALHQNYPNPFNPSTTFSFEINEPGDATLFVHDLLGRTVLTKQMPGLWPGEHRVSLDMSALPAGGYMYSLLFNGQVQSRKMLLVK